MHIGYIGLGKMGHNMVLRLLDKRHTVTVYDVDPDAVRAATRKAARSSGSLPDLVNDLAAPRTIWIMVPHQFVDEVIDELKPRLSRGDTVIDGGNSPYQESARRARAWQRAGINYLDVGVSGGPRGAREGACLMVGGNQAVYKRYEKLFADLAVPDGYGYMGKSGAGHFVKMVHNGIEYGMMQSIAEGFDVMRGKQAVLDLNLPRIAGVYARGSVIESRLMDWLRGGFKKFGPQLKGVSGTAVGTGEGKWTVEAAHDLGVSVSAIKAALQARTRSQKKPNFAGKVIMALRNQFGGHDPHLRQPK